MIPSKELQDLARALMNTTEYIEMTRHRRKVMENAMMARQMLQFERDHIRILNSEMPPAEIAERLKKLTSGYHELLIKEDVKAFFDAASRYQKMVGECMGILNRTMDVGTGGMGR